MWRTPWDLPGGSKCPRLFPGWQGSCSRKEAEVRMKPFLKVCFSIASLVLVSSPGSAAPNAGYRIDLKDGSSLYARDVPVRRGTIITFHQHPGGALTGLPQELILRIEPGTPPTSAVSARGRAKAQPKLQGRVTNGLQPGEVVVVGPNDGLKPGEVLLLGPTGEGGGAVSQQPGVATGMDGAAQASGTAQANGAYGGNLNTNGAVVVGPNGLPVAPSSTDLSRGQGQSQGLGQTAAAPNGFPATGAPTTVGADGFPVLSPGVPGSSTTATTAPVIGPNGTPVVAQPGAPGTTPPVIAPNGTPVAARPGTPGSTPPAIGPNGTPVLAPPGAPGATQPNIGPNGTPVLAPPGAPGAAPPNTAPNGTTAAPPAGAAPAGAAPAGAAPSGSSAPSSGGSSPN